MLRTKFLDGQVASIKSIEMLLPLNCFGVVGGSCHGSLAGPEFVARGEVATSKNYPANQARAAQNRTGCGVRLLPDDFKEREKWAGLKTIGVAIRSSFANGKETIDMRYYLNSLPLDIKRFATAVRGHWTIENTLHWCLDVTFREDESRLRNRFAAENLAWLKRFVIGLIKQSGSKESIIMQRRMAGWNDDYLTQLLGLQTL